jgi:hypothetical protein
VQHCLDSEIKGPRWMAVWLEMELNGRRQERIVFIDSLLYQQCYCHLEVLLSQCLFCISSVTVTLRFCCPSVSFVSAVLLSP